MDSTTKPYKPLEKRIKKGDIDALLARWEFGRMLLAVRGDGKQLPHGYAAKLHANLDTGVQLAAYQKELSRRMLFAEQNPTEALVRGALNEHGSWGAICAHGLWSREITEAVFRPDTHVPRPPRASDSHLPFIRKYYAIFGRIRGHMRSRSMPYQYLWLYAFQHGIEQEIYALERKDRAPAPDRGLMKFVEADEAKLLTAPTAP